MYQCGRPGSRFDITDMRLFPDPTVQYRKIFANPSQIAIENRASVLQSFRSHRLVKDSAADQTVIPMRKTGFDDFLIMGCDPS